MRICFVAHPDDDALWFGNTELLYGFDVKVIMTYSTQDDRAKECISWTRACNPSCRVIFLGFEDRRETPPSSESVLHALTSQEIPKDVSILFTHGKRGEYGHVHHKTARDAATNYFSPRRIIIPHYPEENGSSQFTVYGHKFSLMKMHFPSQIAALSKNLRKYCDVDFLDVESAREDKRFSDSD